MSEGFEETPSQTRAHALMRANFLGLPEIQMHFRAITIEEYAALIEIPERLMMAIEDETIRREYILVADIGLSILDVRDKSNDLFSYFKKDRYDDEARHSDKICWRLVRKTLVPGSRDKEWPEQQALVPATDEIPSARVMVYTITLKFLATGERLFEQDAIRTCDVRPNHTHMGIWHFKDHGLRLVTWLDRDSSVRLGVGSTRK